MKTWLLIVGGIFAVQVVLVLGYLAVARKSKSKKRSELVGSGLAVLLVAMWVVYLALVPPLE